jgi:hypothetical protein
LDLSTRNRLLSIPIGSKSACVIQVYDEIKDQVFRLLVTEKKAFSSLPARQTKPAAASNDAESSGMETDDEEIGPQQPDDGEDSDTGLAKGHKDSWRRQRHAQAI